MGMNPSIDTSRTFRGASREDIGELKKLWGQAFGDSQAYIDDYFTNIFRADQTLVLVLDGRIVSMLTRIPVDLRLRAGAGVVSSCPGVMFYAIATRAEYQGQGLASALIKYANQLEAEAGQEFSVIVPAGPDLFPFYERQGYRSAFYIWEKSIQLEDVRAGWADNLAINPVDTSVKANDHQAIGYLGPKEREKSRVKVEEISPKVYQAARQRLLADVNHISYRESEIYRQKLEGQKGSVDIYGVFVDRSEGEAEKNYGKSSDPVGLIAVEKIADKKIMIKESLGPIDYLPEILMELNLLTQAEEFILRRPIMDGQIGQKNTRAFAVIKDLSEREISQRLSADRKKNQPAYLGLAFD